MKKYDETLEVINQMAMVKMQMNAHKGAIEEGHPDRIVEMMRAEVLELSDAIHEGNIMHVIEEAADVMNFLVAVTHQQIEAYRSRK